MNLKDQIGEDTKGALRAKDELRLTTLRMLSSAFHNRSIEKRGVGESEELSEEEMLSLVRSEVKKRKDAIVEFEKGNRADLAEKEKRERAVLEAYLPAELDDDALRQIVRDVISDFGPVRTKDFGRIMGETMKRIHGQASGDRVSQRVKEAIG